MKQLAKSLSGKIIDNNTKNGIPKLRVEAWFKIQKKQIPLGASETRQDGSFAIELDETALAKLSDVKKPKIYYRIYQGNKQIHTTLPNGSFNGKAGVPEVISLDLPVPESDTIESPFPGPSNSEWRVKGKVTTANGEPVSVMVKAVNLKLNNQQFLGQALTDSGVYVITYQPEIKDPSSSRCKLPDLKVQAFLDNKLIASSGIVYNAEKVTTIDLVIGNEVYKGPSEYQKLEQTLKPCLGDQDPADLTAENVEYLANKTGANKRWIRLYALSNRQSTLVKTIPSLFYGCYRKQLPYSLDKLIALKPQLIKSRIQMAINENIINEKWASQVDDFIAALNNSAIKNALIVDENSLRNSLGKVFTQINIPDKSQADLLNLYVKHQENIPAFWKALEKNNTLGKYEGQLRSVLKVSALTQHHEPATKVIMEHPVFAQSTDISNLAKLSSSDWIQMAKSIGSAPENIPGDGEKRLENYGLLMQKSIMSAFPTQHVAANISQSDQYQGTELPKFFDIATDFSFEGANIPAYVDKLNGEISNKEALINDLSKLQRLFYLAPSHDRYNVMEALDKEGLSSALQVHQFGKKAFINNFGIKIGKAAASNVFSKASYISATTMNLALQYNDFSGGALPYVLQGNNNKSKKHDELDLPDLGTLFGAQSFCACKHCRSVYSAAAYFVDILSYLKEHYVIDPEASTEDDLAYKNLTGLDLLFERRPELGDIVLNCENTSTVIPYLDVINEVLENAILITTKAYQTTGTSDELKANPEHININAYETLADEIFPFSQPFNLWNEEGKVYLEHLNIPRYQMMDTFQFRGNENEPNNQAKYAVQLNLTENGKDIITWKNTKNSTTYAIKDFWGVTETKWRMALSKVRTFIDKAGITYEQLLEFLQLKFVNSTGIIKVKFDPVAPCDIEQAVLAYWDEKTQSFTTELINEKFFIQAQSFFRLLQKTPWTIFELGRIMDSLGVINITEKFIGQAAILLQLQAKFEIETLELVSWWANLNTQSDEYNSDDRSFYARQFLNKAVFDPMAINEENFVFTLNPDKTELNVTGNLISDYLNEIAAALNISSPDLLLLIETLVILNGEIDDNLTLKNLSQLFKIVSLTKNLKITVEEYLIAVDFITADPFNKTKPTELLSFVDQIDQVRRSGFSFAELQYLLLDQYNSAEGIAPTEDTIIALFTTLQEGLTKIKSEHDIPRNEFGTPIDPTGEICKQKLSFLLEEENVEKVVAIVEATNGLTSGHEADARELLYFLDAEQLIIDFSTADYTTIEARYAYLLQRLVDYLVNSQSQGYIIQTFATDLSVDPDTSELLLTELIYSTASAHDPNQPVFSIEDFLDPIFAYHNLEDEETFDLSQFSVQQTTYVALYKSAIYINKLGMNAEEVTWIFTKSSTIGWLDLNAISGSPTDVFLAWRKMEYFFNMQEKFTEGDLTFFNLMDYGAEPALLETMETGYEEKVEDFIAESTTWNDSDKNFLIFLSLLSEITGWETDSLFYLASTEAYSLSFDDFKDEEAFYQLMKCFEILQGLGASAQNAWTWMAIDLTTEHSGKIKQTTKAKYSETQWLDVAAALRDILREKQRDSLTAYLIQNREFKNENALYEYYLLDVETSACTMSSRIVLANSSVQLFIQRHLMNLETETLDLDTDRWKWMKNYRVWEANRKVFLYPENWIEPELRLVKSEFFTDLQNALLQNDVSAELVDNSIKDYLEKLDTVSNIEVCGMYHQIEEGEGATLDEMNDSSIDVLHVFGRTGSSPKEYYYRTYTNNYWSPWEKVNLDVQGELIPVVLNKRLYVFWPEMVEKKDELGKNYWEIKIGYSEYKNGKWLAKKVTDEFIVSPAIGTLQISSFLFQTEHHDSYLKLKYKLVFIAATWNYNDWEQEILFYYDTNRFEFKEQVHLSAEVGEVEEPITPKDTQLDFMTFREYGDAALELPTGEVNEIGNYTGNLNYIPTLLSTPGTFRIPIPHQYNEFVSQDNFFYGDDYRSFFVKPYNSFDYSNQDYDVGGATPYLNDYLQENDVSVGIFNETTFNNNEVENILFENQSKDPVGSIPLSAVMNSQVAVAEQKFIDNDIATTDLLSEKTDPNWDLSMQNQQVEQFHQLGPKKFRFADFYHPSVNDFVKIINVDGPKGLITREVQLQESDYFENTYLPTENVDLTFPRKVIDFSNEGAMSFYNWELFFHIPMLVADRLSQNQRFEEAQQWYHRIFNPIDRSSAPAPNKFWQFRKFYELYEEGESAAEDSIYNLMYALSYEGTNSKLLNKKAEVEQQIDAWLNSPFDPHAIAALRPVAYMKAIVMKYIDNLINWGDHLFRQDTTESINEATQVYILAGQILGKRPEQIPAEEIHASTFNQLIEETGEIDTFSNALVSLENVYNSERLTKVFSSKTELIPKSLYFCIPNNPDLLAYWDTVEDRLFKIRHCMNIEGVVRQLPLFQPPIDPGLLVKARAAGLSIGSVLNDLYAPLPHYRYRLMWQKALEFCSDVKALGNALLGVLEKKDAEEMALLRAGHELKLLQMAKETKKLQLDEASQNLLTLKTMRKITEARHDYYVKIEKLSSKEALQLNKLEAAQILQSIGQGYDLAAQHSRLIPEAEASLPPAATFGGANLGDALNFYGSYYRFLSSIESYMANKASIEAGHDRRWDDWKLQEKLASRELAHIDKQITAAEIRVAIMEKEVDNHDHQVENSQELSDFMTNKFTNKELYDWMSGQLSTVYFQTYQMANDLAKRAQKSFQYELGSDQTFIEFGYWDSLKKGLLSGDKLYYDLKRMEVAYLDQRKRTFELTKSISLAMLDPLALVQLRENGSCYINLPEAIFDLEYPGHYMRRIKSVQLTIPCITGPYTSINCKLTLLDNKWRKDSGGQEYAENVEDYDSRFVFNTGGTQSIATSSGQNDSGMFQLNFNDERYLPFEGAGAVSNWRLEMPSVIRSFDYNTISDVIVQINYTAKDGGDLLKDSANAALEDALKAMILGSENQGLTRMFSLKHEFSNEWYRFLNPAEDQYGQSAALNIGSEKFPFMFRGNTIEITNLEMIMILDDEYAEDNHELRLLVNMPSGQSLNSNTDDNQIEGIILSDSDTLGGQLYEKILLSQPEEPGIWSIEVLEEDIPEALNVDANGHIRLNAEAVKDLIIIFHYVIS